MTLYDKFLSKRGWAYNIMGTDMLFRTMVVSQFVLCMAVASGPVLAGPVFEIVFGIAHAQNSNNVATCKKIENNDHACTSKCLLATSCAALKTCSNAKLPAASMSFTSRVDSNH